MGPGTEGLEIRIQRWVLLSWSESIQQGPGFSSKPGSGSALALKSSVVR